jgi:hypothetical protein
MGVVEAVQGWARSSASRRPSTLLRGTAWPPSSSGPVGLIGQLSEPVDVRRRHHPFLHLVETRRRDGWKRSPTIRVGKQEA